MSYNQTYTEVRALIKQSKRVSKSTMLKIAKLAIKETIMDRLVDEETGEEIEITWDSKLGDDLMLDSLDMVELVMFLEECFAVEIPDEEAGHIVTVGDAIEVVKKCKANKGKVRRIDTSKYDKNKNVVPDPDSPFMKNPPGKGLRSQNATTAAEIDKAMEEEDAGDQPVS